MLWVFHNLIMMNSFKWISSNVPTLVKNAQHCPHAGAQLVPIVETETFTNSGSTMYGLWISPQEELHQPGGRKCWESTSRPRHAHAFPYFDGVAVRFWQADKDRQRKDLWEVDFSWFGHEDHVVVQGKNSQISWTFLLRLKSKVFAAQLLGICRYIRAQGDWLANISHRFCCFISL
jgi:hypothetical protein